MTDVQVQTHRCGQSIGGVAAALLIAFGALLPASEAAAVVVYSGATSIAIPVTTAGIYLNVVTGVAGTSPAASPGWDVNLWGTGGLFAYSATTGGIVTGLGTSTTAVDNLALGSIISAASGTTVSPATFSTETGSTAFVLNSSANYIGFKFLNEATGVVDYGWMQLQIGTAFNSTGRSILGYAYENSGASIAVGATGVVGAVPEPSTFALAAMGLAGLALTRRLRKR